MVVISIRDGRRLSNKLLISLLLVHLSGLTFSIQTTMQWIKYKMSFLTFQLAVTNVMTLPAMVMLTADRFMFTNYPFKYDRLSKWLGYAMVSAPWLIGLACMIFFSVTNTHLILHNLVLAANSLAMVSLSAFNWLIFKETRRLLKTMSETVGASVCSNENVSTNEKEIDVITAEDLPRRKVNFLKVEERKVPNHRPDLQSDDISKISLQDRRKSFFKRKNYEQLIYAQLWWQRTWSVGYLL